MALTIPTQAIKFVGTGETNFNDQIICGCELNEQWSYLVNDGDDICFQLANGSSIGDDFIVNGSFETGSDTTFTGSDWTRSIDIVESTNVRRMPDTIAPCGSYLAYWTNSVETPLLASITQTLTTTLVQGHTYKLTLKSRITNGEFPAYGNANALKITLGGMVFYITPQTSTSFNEYTIVATFVDAPTDNLLKLEINTADPINVSEMYVDCVTLQEYETCSILGHINNGCFEDGQQTGEAISPTFDNWELGNDTTESLTGGYDGGRCVEFQSISDYIIQRDVLLPNANHTIKFWAKSDSDGALLELSSGTVIEVVTLTTIWTQYVVQFYNISGTDIVFTNNSDAFTYLDCVEISSIPQLDIYIVSGDISIKVSDNDIVAFDGGANVCIAQVDYDLPSCFNICVDSCFTDLFLNGRFQDGSGNVFTNWTLTQPTRTNLLLKSQTFEHGAWSKTFGGTGSIPIVTANTTIAPDGTTTADTITFDSGAGGSISDYSLLNQTVVVVDSDYNGSIWLKGSVGGEVIAFRQVGGVDYTYFELTTSWVRYDTTESYLVGNYQFGIIQGYSLINETATIYAWGSQLEIGANTTPYIPTNTTQVTTSLGEFLESTTGGFYGDRAMQIWADGGSSETYFSQSIAMISGEEYTLKVNAKIVDSETLPTIQYKIGSGAWASTLWALATNYNEYVTTFIAPSTGTLAIQFKYTNNGNYGFAMIDNVLVVATEDILTYCSEDFKYTNEPNPCVKKLVWYDNEDSAMGINYASGFKNSMRVQAQLQNPNYIKEDYVKVLNGETSFINAIRVRKTQDLSIDSVPEFIWDRMATMMGVSNIEYNGVELCSSADSEISISYDKNTLLYSGSVTLSPKGEYIVERSYNCS
jgi:hypothetical protein